MKKILVVGCKGQLGTDMMLHIPQSSYEVVGVDFPHIDITNSSSVNEILDTIEPEIIVNCSAYTAVDKCETERDAAFAVNATGVGILGIAAKERDIHVAHISTDYVFDGAKTTPYIESDTPNPQSVYGESKLAGERKLIESGCSFSIFRIAWLYGAYGANFVKTIRNIAIQKAKDGGELRVVSDQRGTPTFTVDVCKQIVCALDNNVKGVFHCTNEGECSWYDFAQAIVKAYGITVAVKPCTSEEFVRPAKRPANSILENKALKLLDIQCMRLWEIAFNDYILQTQSIVKERTIS